MSISKNSNVRILTDLPINNDNYGGHNRVADAIINLIMNEDGGKSVALTGHWGSGKSSIVEMIKRKLQSNGYVFVFNAWAHEGDPLRRAFLEKIINYVVNVDPKLDKEYWEGKIDELAKRKERTKTTEYKKPTVYAVLLFIIASLLPVGLGLLGLWPDISEFLLGLSIFFISLPTIFIIVLIVKYLLLKKNDDKKSFMSLLFSEGELQIDSKTSRTIDPTTIEFQKLFYELMEDFAKKIVGRKFLIVIDNLDRIDSEDAMKMWSTMRTFFEFDGMNGLEWVKNTWLLVPYDFSGLVRLWSNEEKENTENNNYKPNELPLIHSFTEKTFQVSFETPLFIISDAAEYFNQCFNSAFNNEINTEEIHKVYRVFKLQRIPNDLPSTPREIKLFINDLTATYRQWNTGIPLHLQALYRLLRKSKWCDDRRLIKDLLNNNMEFIDSTLRDLIDKDFREYLAALFFNTEKNKALQLLLQEPLEVALIKNEQEFFSNNQNLPGFSEVCEDIVTANCFLWANEEPNTLAMVAKAFSTFQIDEDVYIAKSWESMINGCYQIKRWNIFNINSAKGIQALIYRSTKEDLSSTIIKSFSNSQNLFEASKDEKQKTKSETDIVDILDGLLLLFDSFIHLQHEPFIISDYRINTSPSTYVDICKILGANEKYSFYSKYFLPSNSSNEIINELNGRITSGLYESNEYYEGTKIIYNNNAELDWKNIIDVFNVRLQELTGLKPNEIHYFIKTLYFFRDNRSDAGKYLKELTINGFIPNLFAQVFNTNENNVKAICLIAMVEFVHAGNLARVVGQANQGIINFNNLITQPVNITDLINSYSNLLIEFNWVPNIFDEIESKTNLQIFLEAALVNLLVRSNITELIDSRTIIDNEPKVYSCLEEDKYFELINKYVYQTELIEELIKDGFKLSLASLYYGILNSEKEENTEFSNFLKLGLEAINKENWLKEYKKEWINGFDLLGMMIQKQINPNLKSSFLDVIKELINQVLDGIITLEGVEAKWPNFVNALDADHKKSLLGHVQYIIKTQESSLSKLFVLFKEILFDCSIYEEDINDLVNQGFNNMLDRKESIELNFIKELINRCPDIIKKCRHHYIISLEDKIKRILEEENLEEGLFNTLNEILAFLSRNK